MDKERQAEGNLRNKIVKYGAKVAVKTGELAQGYVTGISKAGCFVQIGHNTSVRAALTELSDEPNFDFKSQMAIGMRVLGRITKTEQDNTRFHYSLRRSLVVHGVGQVARAELAVGQELTAIVLAHAAENVAFGQIKGSFYKLKVKDFPAKADKATGVLC